MKGTLAVLRFELRLLHGDLLFGMLILAVVLASLLLGEPAGGGAMLDPILRGSVLAVFLVIATARVAAMEAAWVGLRCALPIPTSRLALSRYVLWAILSLLPALAYVLWGTAGPTRPYRHMLTVWLWLLLAGAVLLEFGRLRRTARRWPREVLGLVAAAVLVGTLPAMVTAGEFWLGFELAPWLLGAVLAVALGHSVWAEQEWLPTQSPKELRPRSRFIGGLRKRRVRARTPGQIRGQLGVGRLGLSFGGVFWLFYGLMHLAALLDLARPSGDGAEVWVPAVLVLFCGLYISFELGKATARWAFLRTYPLSRASVWVGPLVGMVLVAALFLAAFSLLHLRGEPARIVGNIEVDVFRTGRATRSLPALRTPAWVLAKGATRGRPAGMPPPSKGAWPLRQDLTPHLPGVVWTRPGGTEASETTDERRYFMKAVRFYLRLVHGVDATDEELITALGESIFVESDTVQIPVQYFFEHTSSKGYGLLSYFIDRRASHVRVEIPPAYSMAQEDEPIPQPMYAYAPALERLQALIGDRLEQAALLRLVLDLCVMLLAILLFVRFALTDGPLRLAVPLLALLAVGLWCGGRATTVLRTVRDAHLASPLLAPVLTVALATLIMISIRRQVGRATPPAVLPHGIGR